MREINITEVPNLVVEEPIFEDVELTFYVPIYFDAIKYFGITDPEVVTSLNEDFTLNFYVCLNTETEDITAIYTYTYQKENSDKNEYVEEKWELTKDEKIFFKKLMEDCCRRETGKSLQELINK